MSERKTRAEMQTKWRKACAQKRAAEIECEQLRAERDLLRAELVAFQEPASQSDWKIISVEKMPAMKTPDNRPKMPKRMRKFFNEMLVEFPEAKNHPSFIRMLKTWKGY